jgi:glycosyltransferase involved in cell wall biosynthesis
MEQAERWNQKFDALKTWVIIPTYNNAGRLGPLLEDLSGYTRNILVINDGSTDHTRQVLDSFPQVRQIHLPKNRGKGWALRQGLRGVAAEQGKHAISMDSDGQHFARDLPIFLERIESGPHSLIVGSRNMDQDSVPGKSQFGRRFSNFWYRLETGIDCPDTQSGFRSYPLEALQGMRYYTRKFEFEIEILVRAAWRGIPISWVPVEVSYTPEGGRISHFRPFRDFARISLLNSLLVILAVFYFRPRNYIRSLLRNRDWKARVLDQLWDRGQSNGRKAISVGFGVFMGILPLWGFQLLLAIFFSVLLRLNKVLVILAANISLPPLIPLIIFLSYQVGAIWVPDSAVRLPLSSQITWQTAFYHVRQYVYGSISLALVAGLFSALLTWTLLSLTKRNQRSTA